MGSHGSFFQERCWAVVAGCQENESYSKVLNFLKRLGARIRCTIEETVAVVEPWEVDKGSSKSLGCVFGKAPADWTNAFKLEISSLTDYYDCFFMDSFESRMNPRFLSESEKGMLSEPKVIESGMETMEGFKEDEKEKRGASVLSSLRLSWFSVIHVFMSSVPALSCLVRLVTSLKGMDLWSCVLSAKSWRFTGWLAMTSERGIVYRTKRTETHRARKHTGSSEPGSTPYMW